MAAASHPPGAGGGALLQWPAYTLAALGGFGLALLLVRLAPACLGYIGWQGKLPGTTGNHAPSPMLLDSIYDSLLYPSDPRCQRLLQANIIGITVSDGDGGIIEANDDFWRIIGQSRADLEAGRIQWHDLTPSEFLPLEEQGIQEANSRGYCIPYEKEYQLADGRRVAVLIGYTRLESPSPTYIAFVLDQTGPKQTEAHLRACEAEFRATFNTAAVGMVEVDQQTFRFSRVNDRYCELTGYTREELLTMTFAQLNLPEESSADEAMVAHMVLGRDTDLSSRKTLSPQGWHDHWGGRDRGARPRPRKAG